MSTVTSTTPYAWPFDGVVDVDATALVVAGGGQWSRFVPRDDAVTARIEQLRARLGAAGMLVVVVEHRPVRVRADEVADPVEPFAARAGELSVVAAGIDGFYGGPLDAVLHGDGRTHLLVCGHGLESAVHSTVRRANDRGYECLTIVDASVAHDPALRHASRSSIEMSGGIFGAAGETTDVLDAYCP